MPTHVIGAGPLMPNCERWKAQVAQRTPLDAEDLVDDAVDVAWFNRTYSAMGKKRWEAVYDAAKFAASGGGHKRAQLFADAMLGHVKSKELVAPITSKRHQDAVRALGLLPLPTDQDKAKKEMLSRYKYPPGIHPYIASVRFAETGFGEAPLPSAWRISLGPPDIRIRSDCNGPWKPTPRPISAKGPVVQTMGEVTVSLVPG